MGDGQGTDFQLQTLIGNLLTMFETLREYSHYPL